MVRLIPFQTICGQGTLLHLITILINTCNIQSSSLFSLHVLSGRVQNLRPSVRVRFSEHFCHKHSDMHSSLAGLLARALFHTTLFAFARDKLLWILEASGGIVQKGSYMSLVLIQHQSVGDGNVGAMQEPGPDRRYVHHCILLINNNNNTIIYKAP